MAGVIIHNDGGFNVYLTGVDGPEFEEALTLQELKEFTKEEYGRKGMLDLPDRVNRAILTGTSSMVSKTLEKTICCNNEGLSTEAFVEKYLTLKTNKETK